MMLLIELSLVLSAIYCGGMWLWLAYCGLTRRLMPGEMVLLETHTFHLGLCFILAMGFLGLLVQ